MQRKYWRRHFVRAGGIAGAAVAASSDVFGLAQEHASSDESPIRLGIASYTFRNFARAQMIGFMKQLNVLALNAKEVKDHLPTDPQQEVAAAADYAAAAIRLHAARTIY